MALFKKSDYTKYEVMEGKFVFKEVYFVDRGDSDKKYFIFSEVGKRKKIMIHAETRLIQECPSFEGGGVFTIGYDMFGTPYYVIKNREVWFRYRQNKILHEINGKINNYSAPLFGKLSPNKPQFKPPAIKTPAFANMHWSELSESQKKKKLAWFEEQDKKGQKDPMSVNHAYWIYAVRKKKNKYKCSDNGGKWLVWAEPQNLAKVWKKIRIATERGLLGDCSKTSTAKENPNSNGSSKVICVYTDDANNKKDVMRVRKALKRLGIKNKIPYKTDQATKEGKYKNNGNKRISLYYC